MKKRISIEELVLGVKSNNIRLLGKAISLVESKKPEHREQAEILLKEILPYTGQSVRIGITGVPGAGKSTFIESFGKYAIAQGKKVAVLAIDPSSSLNQGSILGDKTRMEELAKDPNAFIRPSPSGGFLGGVANTTFETMLLCEAAGYDLILIETVGVGQSEVMVADISDVFLYLKVMGTGDELQGIKRGIMEMVDLIFINKVEEENITLAKNTKLELMRALYFITHKIEDWKVPVVLGSALENKGLQEIYQKITEFVALKKKKNIFDVERKIQAEKRFEYWVKELILARTQSSEALKKAYLEHKKSASELERNPISEAQSFVNKLFKKEF
ncbi:methylmalonyl Co-A mutase-associated GTPase MeaB [Elizabethkingia sp. JS20170427COW]|uniref:methylmalonyl Co-A mutase-associated GTPase MeaB n=1 Tax=Elizabethkingia sp. JS20170427COW TaxID=2583851 RepID=UPI0011109839|nr:methylmalonyl Co-A mutase-associated GTPase MeaB [Elizabethkingia sp. JS20170427COW]QCX53210.1 methylmalonyl Co-A mutase-associated GTPase MeaB [Elizabethkingia sp. JS20170427COW]